MSLQSTNAQSFTPGPYGYRRDADGCDECWDVFVPGADFVLATIPFTADENGRSSLMAEANARLFAAAPDLYNVAEAEGLDEAYQVLSGLLELSNAENDDIRDAAIHLCCVLIDHNRARHLALAKANKASHEATINVHDVLRERRQISLVWSVEDVQERRPDLSDEQAWDVLTRCERQHDCNHGITWDTIDQVAYDMFGSGNSHQVIRCERALSKYSCESDSDTNLVDFLTDAMHWCEHYERDFEDVLRIARDHFTVEAAE